MILDTGICTMLRKSDIAGPGDLPEAAYAVIGKSWYGTINFETSPTWSTEGRLSQQTDARIRILQDRSLRQHDVVVLMDVNRITEVPPGVPVYRITRIWHGEDDRGPTKISDLTLEVVQP